MKNLIQIDEFENLELGCSCPLCGAIYDRDHDHKYGCSGNVQENLLDIVTVPAEYPHENGQAPACRKCYLKLVNVARKTARATQGVAYILSICKFSIALFEDSTSGSLGSNH